MATRKRRARQEDGTFKADNPETPDVNEAWEDALEGLSMTPEQMEAMKRAAEEAQKAAQAIIDAEKNIKPAPTPSPTPQPAPAPAPFPMPKPFPTPTQVPSASEEAPVAETPVVEPEALVAVETLEAAAPVDTTPLADMLADKRKDPEKTAQPQDEGLKPMTEERLQEIRANAITPAAVEKSQVDKIIADAGVEKTRGREIAARLMFNARQRGGFV